MDARKKKHPKPDSGFIGERGFCGSFKIIAVRNPPTTTKLPTCCDNAASRNILAPLFMGLYRTLRGKAVVMIVLLELSPLSDL